MFIKNNIYCELYTHIIISLDIFLLHLYRTTKDNYQNSTPKNSDNTDRIIVMRRGQMQEQSAKQSSLHGSTTWNWRCRSGNGNRSSEERRNSVKFNLPLSYFSYSNY